ncbi:MAG: hypothetical protein IKC11_03675 [Clostridia bacterium]|nr:hypothetical protein [Clostridia bacterium]
MQELLRYQDIDARIRKLETKINESENRKNAGSMQAIVKSCQEEIGKLDSVANMLVEKYEQATVLYNEFVKKLEKLEKDIASLGDENLGALQETVKSVTKNAEVLESNIEMLQKKIEAANKKHNEMMKKATIARGKYDEYKAVFLKEKATCEPEIQRLKLELAKQGEKVKPTLLTKYKTKVEGKMFPVLVQENKGMCPSCRMQIPAGKLVELVKTGIIECENCGKMIYKL